MVLIDLYPHEVSAAMESSARFVAVLLLCHLAAAEFSENRKSEPSLTRQIKLGCRQTTPAN
jgi:hypothetical protein